MIIGITGPSGSGKTTLSSHFRELGYPVIDGDAISRELAVPGSEYVKSLVAVFGSGICAPDGSLLRKKVAEIAFSSAENTELLIRATVPLILGELKNRIRREEEKGSRFVFIDGARIVDTPYEDLCDRIVTVLSGRAARQHRIEERDRLGPAAAVKRLDRQTDDCRLREQADYVILNDGSVDDLFRRGDRLLEQMLEDGPGSGPNCGPKVGKDL